MFSRKWKFEGSCTKKLDQKWKFAEMEIWVRIFCKRGRNGIPFYREWTVGGYRCCKVGVELWGRRYVFQGVIYLY